MRKAVAVFGLALIGVAYAPGVGHARVVTQALRPTGIDPKAQGVAVVSINAKRNRGQFRVLARNLKPGTTHGISVAGVRIGSLTTNASGAGVARFSNPPRGRDQFLGVDPHGMLVEVSDDQGEDVLESDMPGDGEDQGDIQCCLSDDDGAECEETTAEECTAQGGANMGTGTCFPNPCPTPQPSPEIRCCLPDDDGAECEGESAAECSASHGINLGAGSCEPDPCTSTPPGIVTCCVPQGDQGEQEGEPKPEPPECERLTAADCTDEGGRVSQALACEPNPCVVSPSGAFLD